MESDRAIVFTAFIFYDLTHDELDRTKVCARMVGLGGWMHVCVRRRLLCG